MQADFFFFWSRDRGGFKFVTGLLLFVAPEHTRTGVQIKF